jgi:hypothetical protein
MRTGFRVVICILAGSLLPAGTIIHITTWHDNSVNNRYNPNPKNWVGYGQRTIDEMSFAWVSLYYLDEADFQQRVQARKKMTKTDEQDQLDSRLKQ